MLNNIIFGNLNVRSLMLHFVDFSELLSKIECDIICITETRLSNSISNQHIKINGYNVVRSDRNTRGGGVAIYLKNQLQFQVLQIPNCSSFEHIWITVTYARKRYAVGAIISITS